MGLAGCQMTPGAALINCPLSTTEQVHQILELAPLGTPRDEVLSRLADAGVAGTARTDEIVAAVFGFEKLDSVRRFSSLLAIEVDGADSVAA